LTGIIVSLITIAAGAETRLLRQPAVSADHIAFVYGGDIWVSGHDGGDARRVTSSPGLELFPQFSPDGLTLAFTGQYDGNVDVYTVPVQGGEPVRLTFHPGSDLVRGWTRDGSAVLFSSGRSNAPRALSQLWTISTEGGMPERLSLPRAYDGDYSPDGTKMAYVPHSPAFDGASASGRISAWRHYRGGRVTPIWIVDLATLDVEIVPRDGSNDFYPMWYGDAVYFLSDRNGTMNLFAYDVNGKSVKQLTRHPSYDIKSAGAGGGLIVYEHNGYLRRYNPSTGEDVRLTINAVGDRPSTRPRFESVARMIQNSTLSPTGVRAVVEARGDIFTIPAEKGSIRNLTRSPGVADRDPAWSPDGKTVAWFSDEGGEYHLKLADRDGLTAARSIPLDAPTFFYSPQWSPDSKRILFTDKHRNVLYIDVKSGKATQVASGHHAAFGPVWSPDSEWIAYAQRLENGLSAIFMYSVNKKESRQITDGMSDAVNPAFDRNGKYLYFAASTNYGRKTSGLDMSSTDGDLTRGIYLAVLDDEEPSPFLPKSDEEADEDEAEEKEDDEDGNDDAKKVNKKKNSVEVKIEFDGIDQRILAVDVPERSYGDVQAGPEGTLFFAERVDNETGVRLHKYDLKEQKDEIFLRGVSGFSISADGKKLLYRAGQRTGIVKTSGSVKVGDGTLDLGDLKVKVDPRAEWAQIYHEGWRINRDFFYDTQMHGADWEAVYAKYKPLLEHVAHRSDLTYLLSLYIGELVAGHSRTGGGDYPETDSIPGGLLGADIGVENDAFRIQKIYTGENWNPGLRAPLSAPGIDANEGDYILAVNGTALDPNRNLYSYFENTAGEQTVLEVSESPKGKNSRTVRVVPLSNEGALRSRAWIENNRRKVDEMSGGRLAYVYLPDTGGRGYTYFNRYYFAQQHKDGAVIDERFNGGGKAADYMVDVMGRELLSYWAPREGTPNKTPNAAIYGPKVMIINEFAGSGGDFLPWSFRKRNLGTLVGKRTWGGLIGVGGYPPLIDGGYITAPHFAVYSEEGEWIVENEGVAPDIEVEQLPGPVAAGRDPQLERAVEEALRLLEQNPSKDTPRPEPIRRTRP
jgi:tricorn protease